MNTATITVKKIFPPNKGGFSGIISNDDVRFSAKGENIVSQFKEGGKYEITYDESTQGQYTNRTVKTVKALAAPNGATASAPSGGRYGATDPGTSENIFVCGVMNALAGAGQLEVSVETIANMTSMLRMGWRRGLTPPVTAASTGMQRRREPDPLGNDDMDGDDIPFR